MYIVSTIDFNLVNFIIQINKYIMIIVQKTGLNRFIYDIHDIFRF